MGQIILDHTELKKTLDRFKEAGKTIVFTNGCFDILHVGHVRYLKGAKALGDILVVAVNSDTSARRLKGEGRPVVPEMERLEILAALEMVDFLTLFNTDTVAPLLSLLKPHIHARGPTIRRKPFPKGPS